MSEVKEKRKPKGYWTFERCKEEALKYESRSEFQLTSRGAYQCARKNKWLDDICKHMPKYSKPKTIGKCSE